MEMTGNNRRKKIIDTILSSKAPVSGTALGKEYGVSRQVVVQDIALLRTQGYDIVSTARGYIIAPGDLAQCKRVLKVCHQPEQTEEELNTIVDLGGRVLDVLVNHKIYGKLRAPFDIKNRRDVKHFMKDLKSGKSSLLSGTTSGYHFHTITAESEEILDEIEKSLKEKGFLAEVFSYEKNDFKG